MNIDLSYSVNTINHTEEDDAVLQKSMQVSWNFRKQLASAIGLLGSTLVCQTRIFDPLSTGYFYFFQEKSLIGYAALNPDLNGTHTVSPVYILPQAREQKLAKNFYQYLLKQGISLRPDANQSLASQWLWQSLLKEGCARDRKGPILTRVQKDWWNTEVDWSDGIKVTNYKNAEPTITLELSSNWNEAAACYQTKITAITPHSYDYTEWSLLKRELEVANQYLCRPDVNLSIDLKHILEQKHSTIDLLSSIAHNI